MQNLTPEGLRIVTDAATRHGVSLEAAMAALGALAQGQGRQAQFDHPELGGMGQWSQGGMIMIGDMFNSGLKARVDALLNDLAGLFRSQPLAFADAGSFQSQSRSGGGVSLFVAGSGPASAWWPAELGRPASVGAQNDLRYACFPDARRLAIQQGGQVRVYDTGEHRITGFSQQQGGDQSLTFTSQPRPRQGRRPASGVPRRRSASKPAAVRRRDAAASGRVGAGSDAGGDPQDDRAPGGTAPERHSHRGGVCGEEGRAPEPPLRG